MLGILAWNCLEFTEVYGAAMKGGFIASPLNARLQADELDYLINYSETHTLFLSAIMHVAKVENIAGGTMEACRMVIHLTAMRQMASALKQPRRVIHDLGVSVPATGDPEKASQVDEMSLLKILAEDYRVNPGLHMNREDLYKWFPAWATEDRIF